MRKLPSLIAALATCIIAAGCGGAGTQPPTITGVLDMYRAIDTEAHAAHFDTICQRDMGQRVLVDFRLFGRSCPRYMAELWAEGARSSRVGPDTRIVVSGHQALIYDGVKPEKALYVSGRWVLSESPESEQDAKTEEENQKVEQTNKAVEQSNGEGEPASSTERGTETTPAPTISPQLVCVGAHGYSVGEIRPTRCLIVRPGASDSETLDLAELHWTEWGPKQATATGQDLGEHPGMVGSKPISVRIVASDVGKNPTTGAPMFTRVTEYSARTPRGFSVVPY